VRVVPTDDVDENPASDKRASSETKKQVAYLLPFLGDVTRRGKENPDRPYHDWPECNLGTVVKRVAAGGWPPIV
jgi:hypothetical protein